MGIGRVQPFNIAALLICLAAFPAAGEAQDPGITLCYENQDVRPWRYRDREGLNFRLLEDAARRVGVALRYEPSTWKRCLARLRDNEVDGAFAASFQPGRLVYGAFPGGSQPDAGKRLHIDRFVLLRRKGDTLDWDGRKLLDLKGSIGIQTGYSVGEQLRSMGVSVDDGAATAVDLVRKLVDGRVGGAAVLGGEIGRVLEQSPELGGRVELLPIPLIEKPYYLMLSHAFVKLHPKQAEALWQAIEQVRNEAAYRALERRTLAALGQK